MLAQLEYVDAVVPFGDSTPINLIKTIKPDIHIKGGDYIAKELPEYETINQYGGKIIILPFRKGYSTSKIIEKLS